MGASTKMGIGTTSTVDTALGFISENIVSERVHLASDDKFRGEYSHNAAGTIEGPERVFGTTEHAFNPEEVAIILELLGFTASGTSFTLNDSALPERYMTIDREEKVFTYSGMVLASATLQCSAGQPWRWSLNWLGEQETIGNAGTFPAINLTETGPMGLQHAAVTLVGAGSRVVDDISITIDNVVDHRCYNADFYTPERHGRNVSANFAMPYNGNDDILRASVAGAAGIVAWTRGNYSSTWTFGNLQSPRGVVSKSKGAKRMLEIACMARKTGSTKELAIVHDSTP